MTHQLSDSTGEHDPVQHQRLSSEPHRFCGQVSLLSDVSVTCDTVALRTQSWPYCASLSRPAHLATLGWNFVVTLNGGRDMVITFRSPGLSFGDRWHVSCTEGAEPKDLPIAGDVDVARITTRALREELGLCISHDQVNAAARTVGFFELPGGAKAALIHVDADVLGFTWPQIVQAHATAVDGWEGAPVLIEATRSAVSGHASEAHLWTPWGLECLYEVCDLMAMRATSE
jgi:hypothetical protein